MEINSYVSEKTPLQKYFHHFIDAEGINTFATAKCVGRVTVKLVFTLFDNQGPSTVVFTIALSRNLRWPKVILLLSF